MQKLIYPTFLLQQLFNLLNIHCRLIDEYINLLVTLSKKIKQRCCKKQISQSFANNLTTYMELGNIPIATSQVISAIPPMDMVLIISYSVC
jgi:hypothetical protein